MRRFFTLTVGLLFLLVFMPRSEADLHQIELSAPEVWRYNNVLFRASPLAPIPLTLYATRNASTARDDDEMRTSDSNTARILTGGVPLRSIDSLIAAQLFGNGRFIPANNANLQVQVVVRDYQTQYQRVNVNHTPSKVANVQSYIALRLQDIQSPVAQLQLQIILTEKNSGQRFIWDIHSMLASCEKLAGSQMQANALSDESFWQVYSTTAIGQIVHASVNYAVEQIYSNWSNLSIEGEITARKGERLLLSLSEPYVHAGETITLWHRDDGQKKMGHLRIIDVGNQFSVAYPVDVHPSSIAVGDVFFKQTAPTTVIDFLTPPPLAHCVRDKNDKANDNEDMTSE